jgi:hypothetical protein
VAAVDALLRRTRTWGNRETEDSGWIAHGGRDYDQKSKVQFVVIENKLTVSTEAVTPAQAGAAAFFVCNFVWRNFHAAPHGFDDFDVAGCAD